MHDVCDVGAMSDVLRRDRTVPDDQGCGRMYESESRMCRIYPESAADGTEFNHQAELDNRGAGRRMQSDDESISFRELDSGKKEKESNQADEQLQ